MHQTAFPRTAAAGAHSSSRDRLLYRGCSSLNRVYHAAERGAGKADGDLSAAEAVLATLASDIEKEEADLALVLAQTPKIEQEFKQSFAFLRGFRYGKKVAKDEAKRTNQTLRRVHSAPRSAHSSRAQQC